MKKKIGIRLCVEGLHKFVDADKLAGKEVDYLRFPHRHNFIIECELEVCDLNREKEFVMFKHEVLEYLKEKYYSDVYSCVNFGSMSCEMIALELFERFGLCRCGVSEDGENYAVIENE